ncbi:T9SS type A sorting domain-containing protein, partial [Candidatus Neomarinimicrobiota bacterium]
AATAGADLGDPYWDVLTKAGYTLTVTAVGSGSVTTDPEGVNIAAGTVVTLTAVPAEGFVFDGWSGDITSTENPATVTVSATTSITATFSEEVTGVAESAALPTEFALSQNYPNPFNPATTINFALPRASEISLVVYDLLGREVVRLVDGYLEAGYQRIVWKGQMRNGRIAPSSIYILRMVTPEFTHNVKMVMLK